MLRMFLAAVAVSLALAGCQVSDVSQYCRYLEAAHGSILVLVDAGELSPETGRTLTAVYASAKPICDNPQAFDIETALPVVVNAYIVISRAMRESDVAYATLKPHALNLRMLAAKMKE